MTTSPWPHFSVEELSCRCGCGQHGMNAEFMEKIEKVRITCGFPLIIASAFRCRTHDEKVGSSETHGNGPHAWGHALDFRIYGERALRLLEVAQKIGGFTGFGISQKGLMESRFIHLDDLTAIEAVSPRPWIWTY